MTTIHNQNMKLSDNQISIIEANPLDLDEVRGRLRHSRNSRDVAYLLSELGRSPAACQMYSSSGRNMWGLLLSVASDIVLGPNNLEIFTPLVDLVVGGSPDADIWAAVMDLVEVLSKTPPSTPAANFETPSNTNTSWLDDEATVSDIEPELFFEIEPYVFRKVEGFWEKYFNPKNWKQQQRDMHALMSSRHGGNGWNFPRQSDEKSVFQWLCRLESCYLTGATNKLSNTKTTYEFIAQGQMDVYFRLGNPGTNSTVLVAGELKASYDSDRFKSSILHLSRLVRGIFREQPTRRFVHGFLLCCSTMELWVFDRSGLYSSEEFNIISDPERFTRAFVGYATMDDNALGRDIFINDNRQVTLYDATSTNGEETTITLAATPFVLQNAIVCRGTTCYKTDDNNMYVAKFAWAPAKRMPELELLKHSKKKNVQGVVKIVAYRQIATIAEQREGLNLPHLYRFRDTMANKDPYFGTSRSFGISDRKRKFQGSSNTFSKRWRRSTEQPNPVHLLASFQSQDLEPIKEGPFEAPVDSPAKGLSILRRSIDPPFGNQAASLLDSLDPCLGTSVENENSYQTEWKDQWENRIYSCVVVSPAGRVISEFETIKELLESMRDAIRAHESLLVTGGILHRDISASNIIITNPHTADGFKGMLIDLDFAKLLENGRTGALSPTGTMKFMAIEVLINEGHSFRHDLESFFYVLLWMCARKSWSKVKLLSRNERPVKLSQLEKWRTGNFKATARNKELDMGQRGFQVILNEFPKAFEVVKPLCETIRLLLFPQDKNHNLFLGTHSDQRRLYSSILDAFDVAISQLL
ncbi:serine/threonine-protein kinase Sgk2 [Xylaria cubensis]|nr:serine/threonine-protein kinase Sgk2 [Xylaria cubensis]